ncbi:hypothetical protein IWW43_001985 [Coemansia sp. RSA 1935]|nr:hypothetical protein J3F82_002849 [Coemansia sp. RSA 637]KAJ2534980.1 hypothetical protein IWW43_001985 [Coemansia sp. RSA 1935]
MGATDTSVVEPTSPIASRSTDHVVEPSAPPLPPSYDDVISSMHSEAGTSQAALDPAHTQGETGPFGKALSPRPSEEHQPLITYSPPLPGTYRDADTMSSRDFFASLEYKRTGKGYSSNDWWLNTNVCALRRFINECNERPRVSVEVVGSHTEERVTETISTDSRNPNDRMQRMTSTSRDTVVDFRFSLELTPFIHSKGTLHMTHTPGSEPMDIDEFLQTYVETDNVLKQLQVTKKAIWDYDAVRTEITKLVKSTGYPHSVHITFPMGNDCIKIKSHSVVSRVWRHPVTSFLCFVSCACLLGWPVERAATQKWRNKLMSDFVVLASPRDYVQRHAEFIRGQIAWSPQTLPVV